MQTSPQVERYLGTMHPRNIRDATRSNRLLFLCLLGVYAHFSGEIQRTLVAESFSTSTELSSKVHSRSGSTALFSSENGTNDSGKDSSSLSSYKDSDGASKGIVGSLTGLVNRVSAAREQQRDESSTSALSTSMASNAAPQTPEELMERIRKEYDEKNYLWTGDLDLDCFFQDCVFTDPTISFVGTDKFTENTQNLVPIVEAFAEDYRSDLLSISLGSGRKANSENVAEDTDGFYVETRWNMVGSLTASPWFFWKPKIDVIGRTKFWFRREEFSNNGGYKVYFYDESWEIAAWKALLQIITPAGTFPSSSTN